MKGHCSEDLLSFLRSEELSKDLQAVKFTVVFDRKGFSPKGFKELNDKRIACLTYHDQPQVPQGCWRRCGEEPLGLGLTAGSGPPVTG